MVFKPIDLSAFSPERERGLKELYRYSRWDIMFYRSNLWMHSWRMLWMVEELAPFAKRYLKGIDIERSRIMALVHDDAELVFGDYNAGIKALMSAEELSKVEEEEARAIETISKRYPKEVHGYNYRELLTAMSHKASIEAQFVTYVDKLDSFNESMHEFFAGNISILESVMFNVNSRALMPYKYPALADFVKDKSSPLLYTDNRTWRDHVKFAQYERLAPYTEASVRETTAFPFYNEWKRIVLERGGEEGMGWLIDQKEHKIG